MLEQVDAAARSGSGTRGRAPAARAPAAISACRRRRRVRLAAAPRRRRWPGPPTVTGSRCWTQCHGCVSAGRTSVARTPNAQRWPGPQLPRPSPVGERRSLRRPNKSGRTALVPGRRTGPSPSPSPSRRGPGAPLTRLKYSCPSASGPMLLGHLEERPSRATWVRCSRSAAIFSGSSSTASTTVVTSRRRRRTAGPRRSRRRTTPVCPALASASRPRASTYDLGTAVQ